MWHFLGYNQEFFLAPPQSFLHCWQLPLRNMIRLSLCSKTWQTNNLATSYCKLHGILAACAMSVLTEKQKGYSERKAFCTSFSSVWLCARSQPAAVFTQRPWHSGPVTPTGPWHQPGAQPKQWQKAAKKANDNTRFTPPLCLALCTRSRRLQPKKNISFPCNCQSQKVAEDVAQGCSCTTDRHPRKHYFALASW